MYLLWVILCSQLLDILALISVQVLGDNHKLVDVVIWACGRDHWEVHLCLALLDLRSCVLLVELST